MFTILKPILDLSLTNACHAASSGVAQNWQVGRSWQ